MDLSRHLISLVLLAFILATFFSTALTRHRIRHHRDRFKRQHGAHLYLPESYVTDGDDRPDAGPWGPWEAPSACSRPCGGGVSTQARSCRHEGGCQGPDRKHFSCNTQDCPDDSDYRAEQCSEYDSQLFHENYYRWVPYTKSPNPCELNCMPVGERFYYRFRRQAADGTRCRAESLDVCVQGKCQPVGCDMMLGSAAREDRCRQCGGNGTTCSTVRGTLDTPDLQVGYNDMLLIPAGATNIVVKEDSPSNNYLAVRNVSGHYFLNGNWRIDFPKTLRFAGATFTYDRAPQGFAAPDHITCLGPTSEPLYIVLLYQDRNVGVSYEYSVPKGISQSIDSDSYSWVFDAFSACTATCGEGYQTRTVSCAGRRTLELVEKNLCDASSEPATTQTCNLQPCEPQWVEGPWNECSEVCGDTGVQTRQIQCKQVIYQGSERIVDDEECEARLGARPKSKQPCNRNVPCPQWHVEPWKPCDHLCGDGKQKRKVTCYRKVDGQIELLDDHSCESVEKKPETEKPCKLRPCEGVDWVTSEWSGCDSKCGLANETRKVHCATQKGEVYSDDLCEGEQMPEVVRECESSKTCEHEWYTSQWSECSAKCGSGVQTRRVFCGAFEDDVLRKVADDKCDKKHKYDAIKNCTSEEKECGGEWFSGPWSKCDKECGGGTKSRKVICMKDEKVISTDNCDPATIAFSSDSCNMNPCGEDEVLPVNTTKAVEEPTKPTEFDAEEIDVVFEDDDECEDGEWVDADYDSLELFARLKESDIESSSVSTDSSTGGSTESTLMSEDLMLSDSTSVGDSRSTSSDLEGSGDYTSPTDGMSSTSDDTSPTFEGSGDEPTVSSEASLSTELSKEPSASTETGTTSSDVITDTEGTTGVSETTLLDTTLLSSESSSVSETSLSTRSGTDITSDSTKSTDDSSSTDEESSATVISSSSSMTDTTEINTSASTGSEITSASTEASVSSETSASVTEMYSSSTDSSASTEITQSSSDSSASTETTQSSSDSSTENTQSSTDNTQSSTDNTQSSTDNTQSSTDSSASTENTQSTSDSSAASADTTTDNTESSSQSSGFSSELTTVGAESSEHSDRTSEITPTGSSVITEDYVILESDFEENLYSGQSSTDASVSTTEFSISESTTPESTTTDVSIVTESTSEVSTAESMSSESPMSSEMTSEGTSESTVTRDPSEMTSTAISTESTSELSTVESSTETSDTTTEAFSGSTSEFDIWSTTESGISVFDRWGVTPYTIESITTRPRKCKRKKKPSCKTSTFGCCYDLLTPAEGPFNKGCPTPKTCSETKFGCCEDGVSPASGPKYKGCPESDCNETLFGCCPDDKTPAEGNDHEGCQTEPPPPECLNSEFGCCDDNVTEAIGPDGKGCKDCEQSKFGCCPDSSQAAAGENYAGCDTITTTEIPKETVDCSISTYGCCPDGKTAAEGEHFHGCNIINQDNCTISYYGCCPDGTAAALGPQHQGCRMACEDEEYGCCPDNVTAAHGPNREGCCLNTEFGCCPDNILHAQGPKLEGCGCQYSPFGCCPDNKTAARGYDNDGCGCEHTAHGCCPDRYTPAAGPEFQGCACYTFQFGCCPDGVSVAKGPHKQGCGCRDTQFGCCTDDQTPAQGPNLEGCGCSSSKHGCCHDGVSEAKGDNFEECENVPVILQENCILDKDRGSCRNYTVKWYYDMEYGGCSRFWYGGCDGNSNRFKSLDECRGVCVEPQGRDVCMLPKVTGPCEGYYPSWYFDKERKQCAQFIWGGCLGNNNKFETREDCQNLCSVDKDIDTCEQPKEEGPCRGNYNRWYFNKERGACEEFAYGGCKANNNNFPTESACKQQCLQPGRKKDLCALPRAQGNCTERESRWYFDVSENRCMPFYYSGCMGNANSFLTQKACENDCPTEVEKDTCTLPALVGECDKYVERWYYDTKDRRCLRFYYGGCGGNGNNFQTEENCQYRCEHRVTTVAPVPEEPFRTEFCFLESDQGPCNTTTARWFYDRNDGVCKQFLYGNCGGNANNFPTRDECHHYCGNAQDLCTLPMIVGPCRGEILQWFYDRNTDTCQEFNYGGCQGNDNKFSDQESCESRCKQSRHVASEPSALVTTKAPDFRNPEQTLPPEIQICYSPVSVGDCAEKQPAWFYNAASQKCEAFVYSGCRGNANRFISEEQCERNCGRFRGQDICNYPRTTGPCRGYFTKYYYNGTAGRCQEFIYGGCEGNGNRFSTIEECESLCFKREEPVAPGNDTSVSHVAICRLPVESGPCEGRYSEPRWYFNEDFRTCVKFIFTGCGGNRNNFKSFQSCIDFCYAEFNQAPTHNEIDVEEPIAKNPCEIYREECTSLLCPYGTEGFVDNDDCNRCRCYDPCRNSDCPENTRCAIDLNPNASLPQQTSFISVCRSDNKEGRCPQLQSLHECTQECRSDADCSSDLKCCATGCSNLCVVPVPEAAQLATTSLPAFTDTRHFLGAEPVTFDNDTETEVTAEEGSYATLRCIARGNPSPAITWRKGNLLIDGSSARYRLMLDGSLQIVNVYQTDGGVYICIADNGINQPMQKEIILHVADPTHRQAGVIGDADARVMVTLGAPYSLYCYAYGWPKPTVTWWMGETMVPFHSSTYEQKRDFSLLINSVKLSNLGIYTCQAYNGIRKPASWSVVVQAVGPVYSADPEDKKYTRFLVPPPEKPSSNRPNYPYRPSKPSQVYQPTPPTYKPRTPQTSIPSPHAEPSPEALPNQPRTYIVPVRTNITMGQTRYSLGNEISIPCDVDGYPIPTVYWYKNGILVEPSHTIQISESHRLTILNANHADSGQYTCKAVNNYSEDSSTINIDVQGVFIHPNCTDNPFFANCHLIVKARYCTHKYYARFCCQSCTHAGQLPSYGPHLGIDSRQSTSDNHLKRK